jgi:hypothetical protein
MGRFAHARVTANHLKAPGLINDYLNLLISWLSDPLSISIRRQEPLLFGIHGWVNLFAIGFALPVGIVVARYFKITQRQDWPKEVDSKLWWRGHLLLSYLGVALIIGAQAPIAKFSHLLDLRELSQLRVHQLAHLASGWLFLFMGVFLVLTGWLRGTKGGPTDKQIRGDHYDLTERRLLFESVHKKVGYFLLALSFLVAVTGFYVAALPRWSFAVFIAWWVLLLLLCLRYELGGRQIPTYQATWGLKPEHPGNRRRYPKDRRF